MSAVPSKTASSSSYDPVAHREKIRQILNDPTEMGHAHIKYMLKECIERITSKHYSRREDVLRANVKTLRDSLGFTDEDILAVLPKNRHWLLEERTITREEITCLIERTGDMLLESVDDGEADFTFYFKKPLNKADQYWLKLFRKTAEESMETSMPKYGFTLSYVGKNGVNIASTKEVFEEDHEQVYDDLTGTFKDDMTEDEIPDGTIGRAPRID